MKGRRVVDGFLIEGCKCEREPPPECNVSLVGSDAVFFCAGCRAEQRLPCDGVRVDHDNREAVLTVTLPGRVQVVSIDWSFHFSEDDENEGEARR